MTPQVSVIIPCYNHAHYLPCAVNSVLAQTIAGWEAIIVDDGSTDDTRAVAAELADPRIRYIYQENRGLSAARNTGIHIAEGEHLAFLDADDEWTPRFLEACLRILKDNVGVAAAVSLVQFVDESGMELPRLGGRAVAPEDFRERMIEGGFFPPNAIVVRASAVRNAGLFDESLSSVEDWDLWLRITGHDGKVISIPEPLARYRVSVGSMSTDAGRMHANRMAVLAKHFGPPDGDPSNWPDDKRRGYAFAYRSAAMGYIAQQEVDEGWRYLLCAADVYPGLLQRLDTFYELILGDQPRGYRGDAKLVDLSANGAEMLRRLDGLFVVAGRAVQKLKGPAYGSTYLALAMLSDQAGDWAAARRYLRGAVRSHPVLLWDGAVMRRMIKLCLGQRAAYRLRRLRRETAGNTAD